MVYKIKYIGNPEGIDLVSFIPDDTNNFFLEVEIEVQFGDNEDNYESYFFSIGSPEGLASYCRALLKTTEKIYGGKGISFIDSVIVIERYDYHQILKCVRDYLQEIKGKTQTEQSLILARRMDWEFLEEHPDSYQTVFSNLRNGK